MLLVKLVFAFVLTAVLPDVVAVAVHYSVLERALKVATVCPLEAPIATHFIVLPGAAVPAAIRPEVNADALFDAVLEETMIVAPIAPHFNPFSVLFVLGCHLGSRVKRINIILDVKTEVLSEHAQACLPVLLPETFVNFFSDARGSENAKATGLTIDPVAFERAAIWPN